MFSYQAEKEEQAAMQQHTEEAQQPTSHLSEWGGAVDQPTSEVSDAAISLSKRSVKYVFVNYRGRKIFQIKENIT